MIPGHPAYPGRVPEVYLDHAASSPLRPAAREAWLAAAEHGANPHAAHRAGRRARRVLEDARDAASAALGCGRDELVWTSGGTESDNLAVRGLYRSRVAEDPRRRVVVVPATEHPAVSATVDALAGDGATAEVLPVTATGVLDPAVLADALERHRERVALVACMWANNETGALHPIADLAALAAADGVPVHVDAVQAVPWLDVAFDRLAAGGVTTMAVSGHKVGAPVGTGALLVSSGTRIEPVAYGGGQERGRRSGTVSVPGAAALAAALAEVGRTRDATVPAVAALRERLATGIRRLVPDARVSGPTDPAHRLPGICHVVVPGADAEVVMFLLDSAGIAASAGSACHSGVLGASPVLLAHGLDPAEARSGLRLSLGPGSTDGDVAAVLAVVADVVARAREVTGASHAVPHQTPAGAR